MDLRNFFTRKRVRAGSSRDSEDDEDVVPTTLTSDALTSTNSEASVVRSVCSKAQKRNLYKARLSYKKDWEQKYPWVYCDDPKQGMFCKLCQKRGNVPSTARGAWTIGEFRIGITLLNNSRDIASQNVTEMLLSMLEWQNKERSRVSYNCNVQQLLRRLKKGEQRTET